jgi:hypothetical protein
VRTGGAAPAAAGSGAALPGLVADRRACTAPCLRSQRKRSQDYKAAAEELKRRLESTLRDQRQLVRKVGHPSAAEGGPRYPLPPPPHLPPPVAAAAPPPLAAGRCAPSRPAPAPAAAAQVGEAGRERAGSLAPAPAHELLWSEEAGKRWVEEGGERCGEPLRRRRCR